MSLSFRQFLDEQERLARADLATRLASSVRESARIRKSDVPFLGLSAGAVLLGILIGRRRSRSPATPPPGTPGESLVAGLIQAAVPLLVAHGKPVVEAWLARKRPSPTAEPDSAAPKSDASYPDSQDVR